MPHLVLNQYPRLRDISSLGGMEIVNTFTLQDNPALTLVPSFDRLVQLEHFLFMGLSGLTQAPAFPRVTRIGTLIVDGSTVERMTGFSALQSAEHLSIQVNPNLSEVNSSELRCAKALLITRNPLLDGEALASSLNAVQSPRLRVPVDQVSEVFDPCPWVTDELCDEGLFCASGTDPACC